MMMDGKEDGTRVGIRKIMIQAPSLNLVTAKTIITTKVQTAPKPLITILNFHC